MLRLLTVGALAGICLAAALPPMSAHGAAGAWSLDALMPPGSTPVRRGTPFWLELRNDSGSARLVCVQGAVVALKSPDVAFAPAHALDASQCRAITDYVVVRPGHALSRVVYVKPRQGALRAESEPLIELIFLEREVGEPFSEGRRVSARWVGTIADARRAGDRLATAD
jgi:hypothetical protein